MRMEMFTERNGITAVAFFEADVCFNALDVKDSAAMKNYRPAVVHHFMCSFGEGTDTTTLAWSPYVYGKE